MSRLPFPTPVLNLPLVLRAVLRGVGKRWSCKSLRWIHNHLQSWHCAASDLVQHWMFPLKPMPVNKHGTWKVLDLCFPHVLFLWQNPYFDIHGSHWQIKPISKMAEPWIAQKPGQKLWGPRTQILTLIKFKLGLTCMQNKRDPAQWAIQLPCGTKLGPGTTA